MAKVENKNVSPVVALIANWFVFGILGYYMIGQTNKGIMVVVATMIGSILCVLPGMVIALLALMDVFQTAQAIEKGEDVDENEYKNGLLFKIVKIIHKDAIFNDGSASSSGDSAE
ncbi:MAG: hypothetical protein COA79_10065 [Planctomycetota bacterium]|nr:MAG: hypothetical protein COA79_10065 [Planctomycetota bacterium]